MKVFYKDNDVMKKFFLECNDYVNDKKININFITNNFNDVVTIKYNDLKEENIVKLKENFINLGVETIIEFDNTIKEKNTLIIELNESGKTELRKIGCRTLMIAIKIALNSIEEKNIPELQTVEEEEQPRVNLDNPFGQKMKGYR